ncbi:MAG TPA: hemerythrin domain-containing protein [Mangrovimonas sp.]|nr:hemerythrin domain-containing protein [Mangrovimonas sp.]
MSHKPQKRHKALQPLSRDHHYGLLLCWKIRAGFNKKIDPKRIWIYVSWFYKNHLISHFELEEKYIFPILGNGNALVKKALSQHRRLHRLFKDIDNKTISLNKIEEELDKHIRFEERILFPEIQKTATESQLLDIEKIHYEDTFKNKIEDEFWK